MIWPLGNLRPRIDPSAYVHHSAVVVGDVEIGAEASLWFHAVVRGDVHWIRIGPRTNIQDGAVVHVTGGRWPTEIGEEVTVGHGAIVHGCRIGPRCLVGIGAIVMDGCEIGEECLIAAGALVTPGTQVPPRHLVLGHPARAVRPLREDEIAHLRASAANYVANAARYRQAGIE